MGKKLIKIPPRLQWENHHGYCGQTAIQSVGLHFGHYFSALQVRKKAGSEVLVGENATDALDKLGLAYQEWDNEAKQPQHKAFLAWTKKHILKGHPVIFGAYAKGEKSQEYDHILLAVGVESTEDQEILIYCDFFQEKYLETDFDQIWDTRSMHGNGKDLDWAIPRDIDYGIAVLGRTDSDSDSPRIEISLEDTLQPNVSIGEQPEEFELQIKISNLNAGQKYVLFIKENGHQKKICKLTGDEGGKARIEHTVSSDSLAFFRCEKIQ